jgi:hypothetical protein
MERSNRTTAAIEVVEKEEAPGWGIDTFIAGKLKINRYKL